MSLSPALTPDDVDAPHIASIVEQFHGPWRGRGTTADTKLSKFQEVRVSRSASVAFRVYFVCFFREQRKNSPGHLVYLVPRECLIRRDGRQFALLSRLR
jgi:hypothetical protein